MDDHERQARWATALGIPVDEFAHDDSEYEQSAVEADHGDEEPQPHPDRWAS